MASQTLTEVFRDRMQRTAYMLRDILPAWHGYELDEDGQRLVDEPDGDGRKLTLTRSHIYHDHWHPTLIFGAITPAGTDELHYGDETTLRTTQLPSIRQRLDNTNGDSPLDYDLTDAFGKATSEEKESSKSAGGSVSVTLSAEESIEGVATFDESVTAEVHAEISSRQTKAESTSQEHTADLQGSVSPGVCETAVLALSRRDVAQPITTRGDFSFTIAIGATVNQQEHLYHFDSWDQLRDIVSRPHAQPDNAPLVGPLREHPPSATDRAVLEYALDAPLKYTAKYEGMLERDFHLERC